MPADTIVLSGLVSGTDATATLYLENKTSDKVVVQAIDIMPHLAVATHASNYITTTVTAGGTTLVTAHTTNSSGGSAMVAGTSLPFAFAATGVGTALELAAGGTLLVAVAKAGTGPAYNFSVNARCAVLGRGF
jgi:hypothetical protein